MTRSRLIPWRSRPKELGQTMVLISAGIVTLIAATGLAVDIGSARNIRERMQTAADSAAIAGVEGIGNDNWRNYAKTDAAKNGFSDGEDGVSVNVYHPPQSGSYAGNSDYLQVVISQPQPTYFMRVLGMSTMNVSANATGHMGSGPNCIYVLDPQASGALGTMTASGGAAMTANCGIIVDSNSSTAVTASGTGTIVKASHIGIVGNYSIASGALLLPTPQTGIIPADDPLLYVAAPSAGQCIQSKLQVTKSMTLDPGTYCNGINVSAANTTLTLNAGTYVILGGGLYVGGNSTIKSNGGVTIYNSFNNTWGYNGINIQGGATVDLHAPTSGPLAGMLFFQDRGVAPGGDGSSIGGGASQVLEGALYFPTTSLKYQSGSTTNAKYTIVVADTITMGGAITFGDDYSALADGSPIKAAVLVE